MVSLFVLLFVDECLEMDHSLVVTVLLVQVLRLQVKTLIDEHEPFQVVDFARAELPVGGGNNHSGGWKCLLLIKPETFHVFSDLLEGIISFRLKALPQPVEFFLLL